MANGFDDFLRGFSAEHPLKPVVSELEARNKQKLELAMLSKRIQMEQEAKQVPLDQFQQTLGFLQGQVPANELKATSPVAQQAAFAGTRPILGQQARAIRPMTPKSDYVKEGNKIKFVMRDRMTGQVLREENIGINPTFAKEAAQVQGEFTVGNNILDQVGTSLDKFLSNDYITRLPQGASTRLSALIQSGDPDALSLTSAREAFAIWLTSSISGKQMTEKEQNAFLKMLPVPEDTLDFAQKKLDIIRGMIDARTRGTIEAYTGEKQAPKKEKKPLSSINKPKPSQAAKDYLKSLGL